jgi:hypothetical protein
MRSYSQPQNVFSGITRFMTTSGSSNKSIKIILADAERDLGAAYAALIKHKLYNFSVHAPKAGRDGKALGTGVTINVPFYPLETKKGTDWDSLQTTIEDLAGDLKPVDICTEEFNSGGVAIGGQCYGSSGNVSTQSGNPRPYGTTKTQNQIAKPCTGQNCEETISQDSAEASDDTDR